MSCESCEGLFPSARSEREPSMTCAVCGAPLEAPDPIPVEHLPEVADTVVGIDVSHHNVAHDWAAVKGAGIEFAIVRVSHGVRYDREFCAHLEGARRAGLIVGCYHYFEAADVYSRGGTPTLQARAFVAGMRTAGVSAGPGVLPPSLDIEEGTVDPSELLTWLDVVQHETGWCPWIYTMLGWWGSRIGNDPRFGRYPLWAADWTPPLDIPKPWTDAVMWQHTNVGRVPGVVGNVDLNRFVGSLATLRWVAGFDDV